MTRHAGGPVLALLSLVALSIDPTSVLAQSTAPSPAPTPIVAPAVQGVPQAADIAQLRWLAGCWELRTPTRVTQESWMLPGGGIMLGTSRTVVRDVVREFEFLRIELRDGRLTYVAQPGGGPPTAFAATFVSDTAARFENPQHDFPQGIAYRRAGSDSVVASIDGPQAGAQGTAVRAIRYPMRRVPCAP